MKPIDIVSASLGVDFERDPLPKIISGLAEAKASLFSLDFGNAFVCICLEPEAINTLKTKIESIQTEWERRI